MSINSDILRTQSSPGTTPHVRQSLRQGATHRLRHMIEDLHEAPFADDLIVLGNDAPIQVLLGQTTGSRNARSFANPSRDQAKSGRELRSGCSAEEKCKEITLSPHVVCWCARDLALADHRHDLIASNRPGGCHEALEAQPRANQPLDALVIRLDDVIQKFACRSLAKRPTAPSFFMAFIATG